MLTLFYYGVIINQCYDASCDRIFVGYEVDSDQYYYASCGRILVVMTLSVTHGMTHPLQNVLVMTWIVACMTHAVMEYLCYGIISNLCYGIPYGRIFVYYDVDSSPVKTHFMTSIFVMSWLVVQVMTHPVTEYFFVLTWIVAHVMTHSWQSCPSRLFGHYNDQCYSTFCSRVPVCCDACSHDPASHQVAAVVLCTLSLPEPRRRS
jgi:hypothetical protein